MAIQESPHRFGQGREVEEFPVPAPFQEGVQVVSQPGLCLFSLAHLMLQEGSDEDEPPVKRSWPKSAQHPKMCFGRLGRLSILCS